VEPALLHVDRAIASRTIKVQHSRQRLDAAKQAVAAGMDKALAGAEGLRDALLWMTPFFAVAVFFMVLQYLALRREVKAEGPVSDGGFAAGVLLLLVGVAGLLVGGVLYAFSFPWIAKTILPVGALGKVRLPDVTGVPALVWFIALIVIALTVFFLIERAERRTVLSSAT
jgi:hypothetical protein